jgi:hypothetical protein
MKKALVPLTLALAVTVGLVSSGLAVDEVTLSGKILCAKCTLKKADAKVCQNVLVVTGAKAGEYYLAKNAVSDKLGDVCTAQKPVTVAGRVSEKDGKRWIEASKIEEPKP